METEKKYALLIDADNISPKYIEVIMREAEVYGVASIRRIYGDWTNQSKISWKECLLDQSLSPVQQYSYTSGKNSSDSAMIIDAMDILYGNDVDGFIIVTSDSDFTRLAVRLRESGKRIIGMGESKTPSSFIKACEQFKTLDVLYKSEIEKAKKEAEREREAEREAAKEAAVSSRRSGRERRPAEPAEAEKKAENAIVENAQPITSLRSVRKTVMSLLEEKSDEEGWMFLGDLGNMIIKRYPDFDARNYGYKKMGKMIASFPDVEQKKVRGSNGSTLIYVKSKAGQ